MLGHCQLRALGSFQINHCSGTGVAQSCFYGEVPVANCGDGTWPLHGGKMLSGSLCI